MKNSNLRILAVLIFFIGMLGELGMQTFARNAFGNNLSPALWLGFGLLSVFSAFFLLINRAEEIPLTQESTKNQSFVWGAFILCASVVAFLLNDIYAAFEISQYNSDIVPSIQLYVRRLLGGELVYQPLVFDGWTVLPTYFPMMWLPYVFTEILDIDYRWTAYFFFLGALALYVFKINKQSLPVLEKLLKTVIPFLLILVFIVFNKDVFGHAVELLPISFYFLLCYFLYKQKSQALFALAIVFCLLSRYAFTLWLPLIMLIYWVEYGFKSCFKVSLYVLMGVVVIYVIPFLSKNWNLIGDGLAYYEKTAIRQWAPQGWQEEWEKPYHLFQGLSFTAWFYDHGTGDAAAKMGLNKTVHAIVSFSAAGILALGWLILRRKITDFNVRLYALVGLKFYLMFFYGFIYVPFAYLFMLPLFLSVPILFETEVFKNLKSP